MDRKVLKTLFDDGIMSALYKAGFISSKAFRDRDIHLWVDAQVKTRNVSKYKAIIEASYKFKVSEDTVKRAVKAFKEDSIK